MIRILVAVILFAMPVGAQVSVELIGETLQFDPQRQEPEPSVELEGRHYWEVPVFASGAVEPVVAVTVSGHATFSGFTVSEQIFPIECPLPGPFSNDSAAAKTASLRFDFSGAFADAAFLSFEEAYGPCLAIPQDSARRDFVVSALGSTGFSPPFAGAVLSVPAQIGTLLINSRLTDGAEVSVAAGAGFFPEVASEVLYESGSTQPVVLQPAVLTLERLPIFRRGKLTAGTTLTLPDALGAIEFLFSGGPPPGCFDALDANDDGVLNIADPLAVITVVLGGGPNIDTGCGPDLTPDALSCSTDNCP